MVTARRWALRLGGALALLVSAYLLAAWIGAAIPVNDRWRPPERGVTVLVESNGVHTAIVMPVRAAGWDWAPLVPTEHLRRPGRPYTHIGFSWGDRQFFLETPRWRDVRPSTVARIVIGGGDSLLHATHYVRPAPGPDLRPLTISTAQYRKLARSIAGSFARGPGGKMPPPLPGYATHDAFYPARGRYTLMNTCNNWTARQLAAAGIRTGLWTPLPGGVMRWVPEPAAAP